MIEGKLDIARFIIATLAVVAILQGCCPQDDQFPKQGLQKSLFFSEILSPLILQNYQEHTAFYGTHDSLVSYKSKDSFLPDSRILIIKSKKEKTGNIVTKIKSINLTIDRNNCMAKFNIGSPGVLMLQGKVHLGDTLELLCRNEIRNTVQEKTIKNRSYYSFSDSCIGFLSDYKSRLNIIIFSKPTHVQVTTCENANSLYLIIMFQARSQYQVFDQLEKYIKNI